MEREQSAENPQARDEEATRVTAPKDGAPDEGMPYDPEMTEGDEANAPEGSAAQKPPE